ncbi:MAG: phosphatase PAP2 family protein [Chloroflexota bacterium]
MFTGLENGLGLDVVLWIQTHGSPLLDFVAQAIHVLGSPAWYLFLLLPLLLRGLKRQRAYQWVFTLVVAILLTDIFKLAFHAPRPYQVAPDLVRMLVIQSSNYGLPSGHVAGALAMSGLAVVWGGRRWMWVLVAWTLLVGWAQMYAGVHYPQDVIAGVIVGTSALWISLRLFDRFIMWWDRIPQVARAAGIVFGLVVVFNLPGI